MQPSCAEARPRTVTRLLAVCALAFALLALPTVQVHACSCAGFGGPADAVASSDLAFIGTVVDSAPDGDLGGLGPTVRYAFSVERASAPVAGGVVEVQALDDPGGAACGFAFGEGERWFVSAHTEDGSLQTSLCSGNVRMDQIADADLARLVAVLPAEPVQEPTSGESAEPFPVPVVGGVALIALLAVAYLAFRHQRPVR